MELLSSQVSRWQCQFNLILHTGLGLAYVNQVEYTEPLYNKNDLADRKPRSDKGKPRSRRASMATPRTEDLESIRYSVADPTAGGAENIKPGTLGRLKEIFQISPKDKDCKSQKETGTKPKIRQEPFDPDDWIGTETVRTAITVDVESVVPPALL